MAVQSTGKQIGLSDNNNRWVNSDGKEKVYSYTEAWIYLSKGELSVKVWPSKILFVFTFYNMMWRIRLRNNHKYLHQKLLLSPILLEIPCIFEHFEHFSNRDATIFHREYVWR